jgi:hypothetical protein
MKLPLMLLKQMSDPDAPKRRNTLLPKDLQHLRLLQSFAKDIRYYEIPLYAVALTITNE